MFLNNISDPDYKTTKAIVYSSKSTAIFDESVKDARTREDDFKRTTNRERESEKIR